MGQRWLDRLLGRPSADPEVIKVEVAPVSSDQLHSDVPITGSKEAPDLLNRESFARRIADGLRTVPSENGFVLSLEGPWGYGKTSLLNLVQLHVSRWPEQEQPILCRFNPWMIGNAGTLVQAFLVQLAGAIGIADKTGPRAKAARELLGYSSLFTVLKFLPGAEPWASIVEGTMKAVGSTANQILELRKLDLDRRKRDVIAALKELGRPILIFVDDLDRLPPSEVFEMVRLVKSVGDFPGVIYVLCFDSGYVASALKGHKVDNPESYLDKVIQTRLSLPLISKDDLLKILNSEFDSLPPDATKERFPKQQERMSEIYYYGLRQMLETPRDVKRLFNRLRFVEPGCRGDVNIGDLVGLEAIAIKAPSVYEHIKRNPMAYTGKATGLSLEIKKPEEIVASFVDERKAAFDALPEPLLAPVTALMEQLFPLLKSEDRGFAATRNPEMRGLIASSDRLAIALSAGLPSGEVSYTAAVEFLKSVENRERLLNDVLSTGRITRFVEQVQRAQESMECVDVVSLARTLGGALDSSEGVEVNNRPTDFFGVSLSRRMWWVLQRALEQLPSEDRLSAIGTIIADMGSMSLTTDLVSVLHAQHGMFGKDGEVALEKRWVTAGQLETYTRVWADQVLTAMRDGTLYAKASASATLFRLKRFRGEDFKKAIDEAFPRDAALDSLIRSYGNRGTDTVGGRYAMFEPDDYEVLGGEGRIKAKAKERMADRSIRNELRNIYSALLNGKKTYIESGKTSDDRF